MLEVVGDDVIACGPPPPGVDAKTLTEARMVSEGVGEVWMTGY
jgi:hypothetical protein